MVPKKHVDFKIPFKTICRFRRNLTKKASLLPIVQVKQTNNNNDDNNNDNEVLQVFREEQLGRNILLQAAPIAILGVNHGHLGILAMCIGAAAIWNGMLLRRVWPRVATAMEFIGVAIMLLSLFGYFGAALPHELACVPMLCFVTCLVPLFVGAFRYFRQASASSENNNNNNIVSKSPQPLAFNVV